MNNTVFKSLTICLFALGSCREVQEVLPSESGCVPLQVNFAQGNDDISLQGAGARSLVTGLGTAGKGNIDRIGVYITDADHGRYLDYDQRYTYTTTDNGTSWTAYQGTDGSTPAATLYLTNVPATLYAFHPTTNVAVTDDAGSGNHTIPVTIPASQTFAGGSGWDCSTTDYLYGTAGPAATSSATPITAHNLASKPDIYMQHAMAKVIFKIEYEQDATRIENDYVRSITLEDKSGNNYFYCSETSGGNGKMNIGNGTFSELTATNQLVFTPSSNPQRIGFQYAATVAFGLVAPLADATTPKVKLSVTLGPETGGTTTDYVLDYTTAPDLSVQWKPGYCYTYNLKLDSKALSVKRISAGWTGVEDVPGVTTKEKGISSAADLIAFATLWNKDGAPTNEKGYKKYEPYGWYEKDDEGNRQFTIKLTSSFKIDTGEGWVPIGTEAHPLTIPFDGQGWQVTFDMYGGKQSVPEGVDYAGLIGYTTSDVKNVRVTTTVSGSIDNSDKNCMDAGTAPYAGILAARVEGNIMNCIMEMQGTVIMSSPAASPSVTATYVGAMAGYCGGNISNSAVYLYEKSEPKITIAGTTGVNSYIGGLAGYVKGTMDNCYSRIFKLENSNPGTSANVTAGFLAGASGNGSAGSFTKCYQYGGTMENCTGNTATGITEISSFTDATTGNLCDLLNAEVEKNPSWSRWTEKKDTESKVISVYLFNYRN